MDWLTIGIGLWLIATLVGGFYLLAACTLMISQMKEMRWQMGVMADHLYNILQQSDVSQATDRIGDAIETIERVNRPPMRAETDISLADLSAYRSKR